ncbi:MAG: hypothetical protein KatS3mg103_0265 [Phycisphaerales bacterium]|nr:MAG: hypothetical protein KatS3mg103_0265 [Phycisphaerales bacterium]
MLRCLTTACTLALAAGALAQSGPIRVAYDQPDRDRWNYPFSATPGTRTSASIFGALGVPGFDDRDAQFVVGFDTDADVPTGQGAGAFRVVSARLTLVVSNDQQFVYDDTADPLASHLRPDRPGLRARHHARPSDRAVRHGVPQRA